MKQNRPAVSALALQCLVAVTCAMLIHGGWVATSSEVPESLRLELSAEKTKHRRGEPIRVTITLRNVGQQGYWVSKPMGLARARGSFFVEVTDKKGNILPGTFLIVDGPARSTTEDNPAELIQKERMILLSGEFFGCTVNLLEHFELNERGTYAVRAKYFDVKPRVDDKQVADAVEGELKLPIWFGNLESQLVEIQIELE